MKLASAIVLVLVMVLGAVWWVSNRAPVEPLEVDHARLRLVPGGAPMAGYFEMRNHLDVPVRLVAARSSAFGQVMIHRTVVERDSARMEHQSGGVLVAPGETVRFEPGGLHLMLMRPQQVLEVGDSVEVVLVLEGADPAERSVRFTVIPVTSS